MMLAAVGIAVVVVGAALTDPGEAPPIDNLLMPGECVAISGGLEASEVICDGRHDGVVQVVVGFDQACPTGTQQVRDRQGRGWACIVSPPN